MADLERSRQIEAGKEMAASDEVEITKVSDTEAAANKVLNDEPKSLKQLQSEGKTDQVYTDAALQWMTQPDPAMPELCFFDKKSKSRFSIELRTTVIERRFQNLKRQLTLAEVKDAVAFFQNKLKQAPIEAAARAAKIELVRQTADMKPQVGIPKGMLAEDGKLTICDRRAERFTAMVSNSVIITEVPADPKTGETAKLVATIPTNPDTGKADRRGNFWIVNEGGGNLKVVPFCRECGDLYKGELPPGAPEFLRHGYPYEDATKIAELKSSQIRKALHNEERAKGYAKNAAEEIPGFSTGRDLKRDFSGSRGRDHRRNK